jgi:hypothetical protein
MDDAQFSYVTNMKKAKKEKKNKQKQDCGVVDSGL